MAVVEFLEDALVSDERAHRFLCRVCVSANMGASGKGNNNNSAHGITMSRVYSDIYFFLIKKKRHGSNRSDFESQTSHDSRERRINKRQR